MSSTDARLIAGAMSGTSGDGVDIAITRITGRGFEMRAELVHHHHAPFGPELRTLLFHIRDGASVTLKELAQLGREITLTYARATNEALLASHLSAKDLSAVAAHGQTLYHDPPNTIQWFDPSLLAAEVGCAVVSDFRRADCAAGGQGAPLVPFADYVLFCDAKKNRVLLNLGGIANLTWLPAGATAEQVIAFDTGPSNCISDWICRTRRPFGLSYDAEGAGAMRGRVIDSAVQQFVQDAYFQQTGPRSTDGPAKIAAFDRATKGANRELSDLLATAAHITAITIVNAIKKLPARPDEVLASGGGTHNQAIIGGLRALLDPIPLRLLDEIGYSGAAKEALAFALLGAATLDGEPSNVPSVTGAKRRVVLGSITPRPS
jgi:anhydro-N-acetylmuramic acid kinase